MASCIRTKVISRRIMSSGREEKDSRRFDEEEG